MNLYTFSYWKGKERGLFQVIARSEERARGLLLEDGHNLACFDCESVFTLSKGHSEGIFLSVIFEN